MAVLLVSLTIVGASCGSSSSGRGDGGVFKSLDQGTTWEQKIFIAQQGRRAVTIANVDVEKLILDPTNADTMYVASKTDGIFKTTTAGEQWEQLNTPQDRIRDFVIHPVDTAKLYAVQAQHIFKSSDAGATWEIVYTDTEAGTNMTRLALDPARPQRLYAATSSGRFLLTENEGVDWRTVYQVDEPITGLIILPSHPNTLYAVELETALHRSVDAGKTWVNLFDTEVFRTQMGGASQIQQFSIDPKNPQSLYASSRVGMIHSTDGGESWEFVNTLIPKDAAENRAIRAFSISPHNASELYFAVGHLIHKSTDSGVTWQTIETFPSSRRITTLLFHPNNDQILYAGVERIVEKKRIFSL